MIRLLFILFVFVSCHAQKPAGKVETPVPVVIAADNSILFLSFGIRKDSLLLQPEIKLISKMIGAGKMKGRPATVGSTPEFLTFFFYGSSGVLDSLVVDHPLHKHVEYTDENNTFSSRDITVEEAEFFIRIQLKGNPDKLKIFETLKEKERTEIAEINLNE